MQENKNKARVNEGEKKGLGPEKDSEEGTRESKTCAERGICLEGIRNRTRGEEGGGSGPWGEGKGAAEEKKKHERPGQSRQCLRVDGGLEEFRSEGGATGLLERGSRNHLGKKYTRGSTFRSSTRKKNGRHSQDFLG